MKRVLTAALLLCLFICHASAQAIPEDVRAENRDGQQYLIKLYTLSPEADPAALTEEPFEWEGLLYTHWKTQREEIPFQITKQHLETVTIQTDSGALEQILAQLAPTLEYSQDGYTGVLTLDHTTIQTQASGYTSQSYTITDTKQFTGLARNDPSYIPATSVKNGTTLKLSDIAWTVTGTGLADDTLVPTSYTATATYTATSSRKVATGYTTTASYTGEITAQGVEAVRYTVTYLGAPLEEGPPDPLPWWLIPAGALVLLAAAAGICLLLLGRNAAIYAMNAKGVAYKRLGRQRVTVRKPRLDLTRLREYPAGEAGVELKSAIAHKLAGRLITIQLYDGSRTHLVTPYEGKENYWFAVREASEEEEET